MLACLLACSLFCVVYLVDCVVGWLLGVYSRHFFVGQDEPDPLCKGTEPHAVQPQSALCKGRESIPWKEKKKQPGIKLSRHL